MLIILFFFKNKLQVNKNIFRCLYVVMFSKKGISIPFSHQTV